jgi:hypothetical protein
MRPLGLIDVSRTGAAAMSRGKTLKFNPDYSGDHDNEKTSPSGGPVYPRPCGMRHSSQQADEKMAKGCEAGVSVPDRAQRNQPG